MSINTAVELAAMCKKVATEYKTLYVMGCFGAPMNSKNKSRYINAHSYNKSKDRAAMINAASSDTFGFDCVCLIKGILWGWSGNKNATYGGAVYASNGVPDLGADTIINVCTDVSTDFSKVQIGELLWMEGHVGIYIGDGLCVECTPKWDNNVQITSCNCTVKGYNRRNWTKHGKLPYVTYETSSTANSTTSSMTTEEFKKLWYEMRKELQDNDSSEYSKEAREWAVSNGLIQGGSSGEFNGMWQDMLTREQLVTVLYRYDQMRK